MSGQDEFEVIHRCFAPLAGAPGARGLLDDVAVLQTDGPLVITTDAIVEGVHFLAADPIASVAQKALRVNLSDLAAKAAKPLGYLLTLFWPNERPALEIPEFAAGLALDQESFGLQLLGGDTVSTSGPLAVSITAFGSLQGGRAPDRRAGAAGQDLWVSGTIGDGWLGLQVALGLASFPATEQAEVLQRFRTPTPRLPLAPLLRAYAAAAMDLSDGLLADAAKLASASGVSAELWLDRMPVSEAGRMFLQGRESGDRLRLASGGDDYEVLFSADPAQACDILADAEWLSLPLTRIGRLITGAGLVVRDGGQIVEWRNGGFSHRLGR